MILLETMRTFFKTHGLEKKYWIAFSGGLDSQVLLSLCHTVRQTLPIKISAIHINHQLSKNADAWAKHCEAMCQQYQIDYHEQKIHLPFAAGDSLEESARELRYAAFANYLKEEDVLLTAHHEDDQAETVLIQLLRGGGPKGLAAMPACKTFASGFHGRPLLAFSRQKLHDFARQQELHWLEDESNQNRQFTRNFIRHDILSLLKSRLPSVTETISRSAAHFAESQQLLDELAQQLFATLQGSVKNTLAVKKLLLLSPAKQRLILRYWMQKQGHPLPDYKKIETIRDNVLTAAIDRMPCVQWQQSEVRRFRDDLYLLSTQKKTLTKIIPWDLKSPMQLPGIGFLQANAVLNKGFCGNLQNITVRFRVGGEVANLKNRGHHTLKNLFHEWRIPPWERDRIPLIFVDEIMVAAVGYFVDPDFLVKSGEVGYEVTLLPVT